MTTGEQLAARICLEGDVRRLLELRPLPDGRWAYWIETPFESFPRYVIGSTDAQMTAVRIEFKCGQAWSARQAWETAYGQIVGECVGELGVSA